VVVSVTAEAIATVARPPVRKRVEVDMRCGSFGLPESGLVGVTADRRDVLAQVTAVAARRYGVKRD
jgi:hypothetical protein